MKHISQTTEKAQADFLFQSWVLSRILFSGVERSSFHKAQSCACFCN